MSEEVTDALRSDCKRFVEDQSQGEWSAKDIAADAAKLFDFVTARLAMRNAAPDGDTRAPLSERLKDVHYFEMPQWAHEAIDEALAAIGQQS